MNKEIKQIKKYKCKKCKSTMNIVALLNSPNDKVICPKCNKKTNMKIQRIWAMPNHKTFQIKPIKELLKEELGNDYVDPFPYPFKKDALEYLKTFKENSVSELVFDPPYSPRQLKEMYGGIGLAYNTKSSYWSELKNEIARIMKKNGKVISFGWNSMGIGKTRGFKIIRILLVAHGNNHNDTICVVETKQSK